MSNIFSGSYRAFFRSDRLKNFRLAITLVMGLAISSHSWSSGQRLALVFGNDRYTSVSTLQTAREDARAIAAKLSAAGYKATLRLDASHKEMKAAIRAFSEQVEGGDEVVVFFAGHGIQIGGLNYLLPVDIEAVSEAQVKDDSIPLQRILDDMSDHRAKFTLAIIDACRDNPFQGRGRSIGGSTRGLAPTTAATGQIIVFSAGAGQQALDKLGPQDRDPNGVFTRVFLKEIDVGGQSVDRVIRNVRNQVVALARSVGREQVPAIYDQSLGEFFFLPVGPTVAAGSIITSSRPVPTRATESSVGRYMHFRDPSTGRVTAQMGLESPAACLIARNGSRQSVRANLLRLMRLSEHEAIVLSDEVVDCSEMDSSSQLQYWARIKVRSRSTIVEVFADSLSSCEEVTDGGSETFEFLTSCRAK